MAIKITSATFSACVTGSADLPKDGLPIIALVGRSNVGKSSLINTIACRRELAKTSSLPGKTLTINFYLINEEFYIVDLPGYGFAKASKITRQRIQEMMDEFFSECKTLKGIVQIMDIRHAPTPLDKQMFNWIRDGKINYLAVLTKSDKLTHQVNVKNQRQILKEFSIGAALLFSAKSGQGREEFLDAMKQIISGFEAGMKPDPSSQQKTKSDVPGRQQRRNRSPKPAAGVRNQSDNPKNTSDKNKQPQTPVTNDKQNPQPNAQPASSGRRRNRFKPRSKPQPQNPGAPTRILKG